MERATRALLIASRSGRDELPLVRQQRALHGASTRFTTNSHLQTPNSHLPTAPS